MSENHENNGNVLSQDELLKLIAFNINSWVDEEMDLNADVMNNTVSRKQRLEETVTTFVEELDELIFPRS